MLAPDTPRDLRARLLVAAVFALASASLAFPVRAASLSEGPPVQLVESRPIESTLGNLELPTATGTWIRMIDLARRTLDFEEFYLSTWPHEPMDDVIAAIGRATRRGVKVRLLLDARMHRTYPLPADSLAKVPGFEVRLVDFGRIAGGIQHAKFFIRDGQTVFLGSQNTDWRALKHIHELGVRVRDRRVAADFQQVFDMDWAAATPVGQTPDTTRVARAVQRPHPRGVLPYRILQAPRDTVLLWPSWSPQSFVPDTALWDRDRIVRLLDSAKREIVVQLLTYSPADRRDRDDALDAALRRAAARGVKVRMVISDWETNSASNLAELQKLATVPGIEVKLSTVPEWSGGYVPFARVEHCKYAVVDTLWTWVGTANWEPGYFHGTRNVAVTMKNRPIAEDARKIFETSWRAPGAAALDPTAKYPPKQHGEEAPAGKTKYGG